MSIADKITRLQTAKNNIATAITNKGGTVASGDGFEDSATDIASIPSGGGSNYVVATTPPYNYISPGFWIEELNNLTFSSDVKQLGFSGFPNLKKFNCPNTCTNDVTTLASCFETTSGFFKNGTEFDVSNWDTSSVTDFSNCFRGLVNNYFGVKQLDLSSWITTSATTFNYMFYNQRNIAVLDISNMTIPEGTTFTNMFTSMGSNATVSDGAYANGIPYVYVKDATMQNWVLTANNGHPSSWSVNNVIIVGS